MQKAHKLFIRRTLGWLYSPILSYVRNLIKKRAVIKDKKRIIQELNGFNPQKQNIFYLGITAHSNMGDMAQHYCISRWIANNYPQANIIKIESDTVVSKYSNFPSILHNYYRKDDIIIFQSGYTTQDLGGNHELMHRLVIETIPHAHILMMPQTIFFKKEENKLRTSKCYNQAKNMLFLARDMISYEQAIDMFPNITVRAYPDIVTSLIGTFNFNNKREGICFCMRNDGEKFYTTEEINKIYNELKKDVPVTFTDTTIKENYLTIRNNLKQFIENEIEKFSTYEVTITDRYHGTIFSLAAGTPVIILKTNDHKVITGADWFRGIYDKYVYVAHNLNEIRSIYKAIKHEQLDHKLIPYFQKNYCDKLKEIFTEISYNN